MPVRPRRPLPGLGVTIVALVVASVVVGSLVGPAPRAVASSGPVEAGRAQVAESPASSREPVALVRVPFPQDEGTLTPYTFELGYPLLTLVYDTLMWRDADGVAQPWLARSVQTSGDGRVVTIELAEGARWHDGTALTSADVAFTFAYVRDHPHARFTPPLRVVERVETPGSSTVVVRLSRPSPGFADQPLADLPILPAHLWSNLAAGVSAPDGLAMGSGPYRLVDHRPGESYRFEAVAEYFRGAPPVKVIEVPIIDNAEATFQALASARVDMIPVTVTDDTSQQLQDLGATVVDGPAYVGTTLLMNVRRPPFDRPEVRRAVAQAIDLDRIRAIVGGGVIADRGYIHPASPWATSEVLQQFDAAAARSVLSGLNGEGLAILVPDNDPVKREAGRQVGFALERAGLNVSVDEVGREEIARALGEKGDVPSFSMAVSAITPLVSYDPDFLQRLFGTDPQDAVLNATGYSSGELAAATERIATTVDPTARRAAATDALRVLARDAPAVPLLFSEGSYAYRAQAFDGWVLIKGTGILDKRSFVEPAASTRPPIVRPGTTAVTSVPVSPDGDDGGGLPFGLLAVAVAALAGGVALFAVKRR